MKTIGIILLWLGFIAGSLATVFNSEAKGVKYVKKLTVEQAEEGRFDLPDLSAVAVPENGWHLIPWTWYIPAALVCLSGAVLIHYSKLSQSKGTISDGSSLLEIKSALSRAIENTSRLKDEISGLAPSKIAARIDDELADDLRIFAEGRESIINEFDLSCFADVMTDFAAGERSINRAWSASADGYVDEAASCIDRALKLLKSAQSQLESAKKNEV